MNQRFLTKSKFSEARDCPRKIYYLNHREYGNGKSEDAFLKALAEGGFQVGALAQAYYPEGVVIDTLDKDQALVRTRELMSQDQVTIFEGAFAVGNLFIRADIVRKNGKFLELIEVKAKSYDSSEEFQVWHKPKLKKGEYVLAAEFQSYILDVAFQTHVVMREYPQLTVRSFLMMADKAKTATVDGLNQNFKIARGEGGRTFVQVKAGLDVGEPILGRHELTEDIRHIFNDVRFDHGPSFGEMVQTLSDLTATDTPGQAARGADCKKCPFRVGETTEVRSGFDRCWSEAGVKAGDLQKRPFVFDIWNFRGAAKLIEAGTYFADQVTAEDLKLDARPGGDPGLSNSQRQMLQVTYAQGLEKHGHFDAKLLHEQMTALEFPLHFIDFETNMAAIPFHQGLQPYEQIAFQFSHHILYPDGRIEHFDEYLDDRVGHFPNFDFVRALKKSLAGDRGAVLRFAAHENTVLNQIRDQLSRSQEPDAAELISWIQTLSTPPGDAKDKWQPTRQFVDMCEMTKRTFWLPEMGGSNSIKKVLPAILNAAGPALRARFPDAIRTDQKTGRLEDPYKNLPPIFHDVDPAELTKIEEVLVAGESLADGGAAMMAWARMQFSEMSTLEKKSLREALLRYCKLDTLAMVMIWEWWRLECEARFTGTSEKKRKSQIA